MPAVYPWLMNEPMHPLIAILRGIRPEEVVAVCETLFEKGFRTLEVPLNSPQPLQSIALLAQRFGAAALVGAGTVLSTHRPGPQRRSAAPAMRCSAAAAAS